MNVAERQKPPPGALVLDHVSHFVEDLDAAARVFQGLGFKVTATSAQETREGPLGTSNRCVMLEEGYIELMSPVMDTPNARRVREMMARHRGVHVAVFGTSDAERERRLLEARGFAPQPLIEFERPAEKGVVKFRLARAAPEKMPEGRVQYVQQLTPEMIWTRRDVNPMRLAAVFVAGPDPAASAARWAHFSGLLPLPYERAARLDTARGSVLFGAGPIPAIAGYALACRHPRALAARCSAAGIALERRGRRYVARLPDAVGGALVFG
jgi:hypothetical protein